MQEVVEQELKLAREKLESAELLFKNGKLADAVGRAYYGMFHAGKALLRIYAKEPKTHEGFISEFGLTFIKSGLMDRKFGRMLRETEEARESADYKVFAVFGSNEVRNIIKNANLFIRESESLAKKLVKGEKFRK